MPSRYHVDTVFDRSRRAERGETADSPCDSVPPEADVESRYGDAGPDELRAAVRDLEDELAECRDRIERREHRSEEHESAIAELRAFPDAVHEELRSIGTDARPSVLSIDDPDDHLASNGTGWVIDDGLVVTAATVLRGPDPASLQGWTGPVPDGPDSVVLETVHGDELPVERTVVDGESPVGIVETETDGLDPLPTDPADGLEDGDPLLCLGHPGHVGRWVMSLGRYREMDDRASFRFDGPVSHATTDQPTLVAPISGAPLFDLDGRVVGLVEGPRPREDELAPGADRWSGPVFQGLPDTYDLRAVDAAVVGDRAAELRGQAPGRVAPGTGVRHE